MRRGKLAGILAFVVLALDSAWGQDLQGGGAGAPISPPQRYVPAVDDPAPPVPPPGTAVGAVSSGWWNRPIVIAPPPGFYYLVPGPFGYQPYIPPTLVIAPGGAFVPTPPPAVGFMPGPQPVGGLMGFGTGIGIDPARPLADEMANRAFREALRREAMRKAERQGAEAAARAARRDPQRAERLILVGDRLFRADNLVRASERYQQAIDADPASAGARLRMAQVALVRGDFRESAHRLREAQTVEPDWLLEHPFDVQGLFPEPRDFAAMIATIEEHLDANPDDRDARLVLGAQLYLSGRTERAAEAFRRLADRKPDTTLAAFLDASRAAE